MFTHAAGSLSRRPLSLRCAPLAVVSAGWLATFAVALIGPPALSALERNETLRREFTLAPGGERRVEIDNVFGSVKVIGGSGDRVTVEIRQSAEARREAPLAAAFDEVKLEVRESAGRLVLEQDGPFRCNGRRGGWGRGSCDWDPDYEVTWDWVVTLPADVALDVSTVNDGDVVVDGVRGPVDASNVNGEVRASGLAAEASIESVNGDLVAEFVAVPSGGGSFETVNGEIELVLPASADAEVSFDTMNGEIYSDFEVVSVPQRASSDDDDRRGRRRYRLDKDAVVRIGAGGARFDCETLNGDIVVRSN